MEGRSPHPYCRLVCSTNFAPTGYTTLRPGSPFAQQSDARTAKGLQVGINPPPHPVSASFSVPAARQSFSVRL
ncbi:hypothetical protein NDU88_001699 [Pleurodeles waltl]|uniref:Uncharacterized protein n=1 Tax=Pleurodeles waltl TaxID=8319 RepID=A0AAV7LAI7_PLEWA|nr:hypothetical protein NDU88_001699 [Pleurodeles waltl]